MLLSPRAAMMSLIVVSVAVLAKLPAASVVEAREASVQPRSQSSAPHLLRQKVAQSRHWRDIPSQRKRQFYPVSVPRQVLMIDLNPVIDFEAFSEERYTSQMPSDSASLVPLDQAGMSPARRWNESAQATEQSSAGRAPTVGSPLAAALAPRPGELEQGNRGKIVQSIGETAQPIASQVRHWDAPFPSLGQPQLDRQLRRYLAYLETVGQPDILIVGGQGASQGIDPGVLQNALGDRGYVDIQIFNWGLSDSSAQTVEWLLTELLTPQQLPQLVIWADTSVALNGGRSDLAFDRIAASPGARFLARGLRPQLSDQEEVLLERLRKILSHPISRELPDELLALAQSPLTEAASSPVPAPGDVEMTLDIETKQNRKLEDMPERSLAQANPGLINHRSRLLPNLNPQPTLVGRELPDSVERSEGIGFRLVNWCRHSSGPCLPSGRQVTVQPTTPDWLRQTQAAEEAARRATQLQQTYRAAETALQARQSQTVGGASNPGASTGDVRLRGEQPVSNESVTDESVTDEIVLPAWPQSQGAQNFSRALGFQSVNRSGGADRSRQPRVLRGDQDRDYRNFSLQGEQNRAFHRLMQFSQRQDMAIAFVQLPLSQQYLDIERHDREQSFRTYLNVAAQMTPLAHVDLPEGGESWNDAFFAQPHRLNRYGAAVLSWQIGQALDRNLLKGFR